MIYIREQKRPSLNTQSDSLKAKVYIYLAIVCVTNLNNSEIIYNDLQYQHSFIYLEDEVMTLQNVATSIFLL